MLIGKNKEIFSSWILFITIWVVYAIISMTKSAYAAAMVGIIDEGILNKANSGIINAFFYLFYGGAQLVGIKFLDRVSPVLMVFVSLFGTLISVLGMALAKSFYVMLALWSFCGLAQFGIWPAILRIISEYLLPEHRNKAKIYIAFSYCAGMLINYLVAAIVLGVSDWHMMFWTTAVILIIAILLFWFVTHSTKAFYKVQLEQNKLLFKKTTENSHEQNSKDKSVSFFRLVILSGAIFLMGASFVRSSLDAGLKLWVPTMISESYGVSPSFASMLTTILVFINLGGVFIANTVYPKLTKSPVWAFALCFLVSFPFTILLLLIGKIHVAFIVVFLAVITTMMYAGNQLVTVIIPSYFAKYQRAGSMAAALNAIASFGILIANIVFGWLAENVGWSGTIISCIILALGAFLLCAVSTPIWRKFTSED